MSMPAYGGRDQAPPEKETKWTAFQEIVGLLSLLLASLALGSTIAVTVKQSASAKQAFDIQRDMKQLTQEGKGLTEKGG